MLEKMRKIEEFEKSSLDFEAPDTDLYIIEMDKVIEERCDELDYILEDHGYEIIYRDYIDVATSIFNYKVYFIKE